MDFSLTYESIIRYIRIAVDILVVWVLINYIIKAAKASQRTIQIFQGVIFILVVQALALFDAPFMNSSISSNMYSLPCECSGS